MFSHNAYTVESLNQIFTPKTSKKKAVAMIQVIDKQCKRKKNSYEGKQFKKNTLFSYTQNVFLILYHKGFQLLVKFLFFSWHF